MKIKVEVSSKRQFEESLKNFIEYINSSDSIDLEIIEDEIGFGTEEVLILGLIFIQQSVASGLTYDLIKDFFSLHKEKIIKVLSLLPERSKPQTSIYIEDSEGKTRFKINIQTDKNSIKCKLPNGSKFEIIYK